MSPLTRRAAIAATVMFCAAAAGASAVALANRRASQTLPFALAQAVPKSFGLWAEASEASVLLVNPQMEQLLKSLYSDTLSRTYVDARGNRVMLSIAYGGDQRGGLEAHMPDVCYPAQGFALHGERQDNLATPFGEIAVRRLETSLGARKEPLTYWFVLGDQAQLLQSRFEKRLLELRLGLTGRVPDGLLFRVSSIDADAAKAFAIQDAFARELLAAVPPNVRVRLSGLSSTPTN